MHRKKAIKKSEKNLFWSLKTAYFFVMTRQN